MADKNKFFSELDAINKDTLRHKIEQRAFRKKEVRFIQEWLRNEPGRDYQTWVRHQLKQPDGKVVMLSEAAELYCRGWVDTPAKFGKGIRGKWYNFIIYCRTTLKQFWLDHWKWIITTSIAILALYFSLTK